MPTSTQIQEGVKQLLDCDVVVRMQSDAMQPAIPFGSILYGKKVDDVRESVKKDDGIYIVKLPDKQTTVGRLYIGDPKKLTVYYDDRNVADSIEIERDGDVYLVSFIQPKTNMPPVWETEG